MVAAASSKRGHCRMLYIDVRVRSFAARSTHHPQLIAHVDCGGVPCPVA